MSLWSAEPARWALVLAGGRAMLGHALERAVAAAAPERVVTVIDPFHRRYLNGPPGIEIPGRVIEQPRSLDTGPGVFLSLSYVMRRDPDALVVVLHSDHFKHPREASPDILTEVFSLAEVIGDKIVVLSDLPDHPKSEYASLRNTTTVVARAASLWSLAGDLQPAMASVFEALLPFMGTQEEEEAVAAAYRELTPVNFSRDILERAAERIVSVVMTGVAWCDWGRPERADDSFAWSASSMPGGEISRFSRLGIKGP